MLWRSFVLSIVTVGLLSSQIGFTSHVSDKEDIYSIKSKRKIILCNKAGGENILTQSMINTPKTVYIVRDDFVLDSDLTLPENCSFIFKGGSLDFNGHKIYGNLENKVLQLDNFIRAQRADVTEDLNVFFSIIPKGCTVKIPEGTYNISGVVEVPRKCHIIGCGKSSVINIRKYFSCIGLVVKGDNSIVERIKFKSELDYKNNHDYKWGTKDYRANEDTGVMILANNCIVRNVTVENLRQGIWLGSDHVKQHYYNNRVENCILTDCAICISAASQINPVIRKCEGNYVTFDSAGWPPHFVYFTTGRTGSFIRDSYNINIENISAKQLDDYNMTAIQLKGCHGGTLKNITAFDGCLFSISQGTSDLTISDCALYNGIGLNFRMLSVSKAGGDACKNIHFDNIVLQGKGEFIGFIDSENCVITRMKVYITKFLKNTTFYDSRNKNLNISNSCFYLENESPSSMDYSLIDCRKGSVNSIYKNIYVSPNYHGRININASESKFFNSFSRFNGYIYSNNASSEIITDEKDVKRVETIKAKGYNYDLILTNSFKKKKVIISSESVLNRISLRLMHPFRDQDEYRMPDGTTFIIDFQNLSQNNIEIIIDEANGMKRSVNPYNGKDTVLKIPKGNEVSIMIKKNGGWSYCQM